MRLLFLFLTATLATTASADQFFAVVSCSSSNAKNVLVQHIEQTKTGIKISGLKVEATPSKFPLLVVNGHSGLGDYQVYTAGIRQADGQMSWFWSPDQESRLSQAQTQDSQEEAKSGLGGRLLSGIGVTSAPNAAEAVRNEKSAALLNYDLHYKNVVQEFDKSHTCSDVSINVHTTEPVEMNCEQGFEMYTLKMKNVVSSDVSTSTNVLRESGFLGPLVQRAYTQVQLGTYDACDGFREAK